jgi:hypothetical protein
MKKHYVFAALLALGALHGTAQVKTGFKGGLNYSDARARSNTGSKLPVTAGGGFHIGAALKVPFDVNLYFVPQVQYAMKSFTVGYYNPDTSTIKMKYHYLEIPILLEYNRNQDGRGFFAQFGPSFSVALAGSQDISGKTSESVNQPIKFAFNAYGRMEANLVANLGYQFSPGMQCTIGYVHGLGSIVDNDYGPEITPRMVTASILYWPAGKKR